MPLAIDDPLVAPPPTEVPLPNAPLVRVIAQVRFPQVVSVDQRDFIAPFQESIRATYPVLRQEVTQGILLGAGSAETQAKIAWRFADVEGRWRVTLTSDFLALETTNYKSRNDFLSRLRTVVTSLDQHVEPKVVDRLGIRYIDRITGQAVSEISRFVRPEVAGIVGTRAATAARHSLCESLFSLDATRLLARWGKLPPKATVDPSAVEPIDEESFILDLDMFSAEPGPFSVARVLEDAEGYATRLYTLFRWAVTDDFLRHYGGQL